jgi:hypothetical protein
MPVPTHDHLRAALVVAAILGWHLATAHPAAAQQRGGARSGAGGARGRGASARATVVRDAALPAGRGGERNIESSRRWDLDVDEHWHPAAGAAAVATGAAAGAVAVGSMVYALPGACTSSVINGITYYQCGSSWYQPRFYGTAVSYVVVRAP